MCIRDRYICILLSPDAERPPSQLLAYTGARYEVSDLRDIYGAGTRNCACLSRGSAPRAGGHSPRPSGDVYAEHLRLEGSPETRSVPSSGTGPSQNGMCSGGGIGRTIRAGRSTVKYFRFSRTRVCITPISLHPPKTIGSLGKEQQQAIEQAVVSHIHYISALLFSLSY